METRDYQQKTIDSTIDYFKNQEPHSFNNSVVLELATGAGKSVINAFLVKYFIKENHKVLCIAPSKELIEQNYNQCLKLGIKPSICCASISHKKETSNDVIFCSPLTLMNKIDEILTFPISTIIFDEAHTVSNTETEILQKTLSLNPECKVIGLTATPFRTNEGRIYRQSFIDNNLIKYPKSETKYAIFNTLVCRITATQLIKIGVLANPVMPLTKVSYKTSKLIKSKNKKEEFTKESERQTYLNEEDTTKAVAHIKEECKEKHSCLIFCSLVAQCELIYSKLPENESAIITSNTKKKERERIIEKFKNKEIKYLVNVNTLTTGFDAPNVDCVVIARTTTSLLLFRQMIGRGLRKTEKKEECLILDLGNNIENLKLEDGLFHDHVQTGLLINFRCESCNGLHEEEPIKESILKNYPEPKYDKHGYIINEVDHQRVGIESTNGDIPLGGFYLENPYVTAHYSSHCNLKTENKEKTCNHKFTATKRCEECHEIVRLDATDCNHCKQILKTEEIKEKEEISLSFFDDTNIEVGDYKELKLLSATYEPHFSNTRKTYSIKMTIDIGICIIEQYISKNVTWLINHLCEINNCKLEDLDEKYNVCESWIKYPEIVLIKKERDFSNDQKNHISELKRNTKTKMTQKEKEHIKKEWLIILGKKFDVKKLKGIMQNES